jgi:hypothetical protein
LDFNFKKLKVIISFLIIIIYSKNTNNVLGGWCDGENLFVFWGYNVLGGVVDMMLLFNNG